MAKPATTLMLAQWATLALGPHAGLKEYSPKPGLRSTKNYFGTVLQVFFFVFALFAEATDQLMGSEVYVSSLVWYDFFIFYFLNNVIFTQKDKRKLRAGSWLTSA